MALCRGFAATRRGVFGEALAATLDALADHLRRLGRAEKDLGATEESASFRPRTRRLGKQPAARIEHAPRTYS